MNIAPRLRRPHVLNIFDAAPHAILDDLLPARDAAKRGILGELHSFAACSVDVGESDKVRRDLRLGIVAAELAFEVHPRKTEGAHPIGRPRIDVTAQVHEGAVDSLPQAPLQVRRIDPGHHGQIEPTFPGVDRLARIDPDGFDGGAQGELGAVAVPDDAPRSGRADGADVPRGGLVLQEIPPAPSAGIRPTAEQPCGGEDQRGHHQPGPPRTRRRTGRALQRLDSSSRPLPPRDPHRDQYSMSTMTIRSGAGRSMPRRVSAWSRTRSWRCPVASFKLQTAPVHVQLVAFSFQRLKLDEELAALVLDHHHRERAQHDQEYRARPGARPASPRRRSFRQPLRDPQHGAAGARIRGDLIRGRAHAAGHDAPAEVHTARAGPAGPASPATPPAGSAGRPVLQRVEADHREPARPAAARPPRRAAPRRDIRFSRLT